MEKIKGFQISSMTVSGFKCYEAPMKITFGNPTVVTGGNGRGKTSKTISVWRTPLRLPSQDFRFSASAALTGCTTRRTRTCRSRCALRMIPAKRTS